jgi:hypothetical protein
MVVGDTVKFVGTVVAITEPNANNLNNIWVIPNTTALKDNAGNTVVPSYAQCHLFSGSQITKGS